MVNKVETQVWFVYEKGFGQLAQAWSAARQVETEVTQSIIHRTRNATDLTRLSLLVVVTVVMRGRRMFSCNIRHSNLCMLVWLCSDKVKNKFSLESLYILTLTSGITLTRRYLLEAFLMAWWWWSVSVSHFRLRWPLDVDGSSCCDCVLSVHTKFQH